MSYCWSPGRGDQHLPSSVPIVDCVEAIPQPSPRQAWSENAKQSLTNSVFSACKDSAAWLLFFDIKTLWQNLVCFKKSVNCLMHPFYSGIQKCEGQRPTCHPESMYLPTEVHLHWRRHVDFEGISYVIPQRTG